MPSNCPFCARLAEASQPGLVASFPDGFPVSPGHTLIVPRRHIETYRDTTPAEKAALWEAADAVMEELDATRRPDGYNLGVNVGRAAGQTVMHLHLHVIPRYAGDMADPRGGIRHVIADKAKYWE
ncbi:MAG: HIT family protein [Candidatus Sericytochromatia bacterium]|nr:HIT family protein [Candidatus Sericytochromatia bacterium]